MNATEQIKGWRNLLPPPIYSPYKGDQGLLGLYTGWDGVLEAQAGAEGSHA